MGFVATRAEGHHSLLLWLALRYFEAQIIRLHLT
jgi:hypothetical protein